MRLSAIPPLTFDLLPMQAMCHTPLPCTSRTIEGVFFFA